MIYYVSQKATLTGKGTKDCPFGTINEAAQLAKPGDTVIISEGIYRERVTPKFGGEGNNKRITYKNADGETPCISGAEVATNWENYKDTVWTTKVDNSIFGDYNPYDTLIYGDWYAAKRPLHTGEIYFNGEYMYETDTEEELFGEPSVKGRDLRWFAKVGDKETTFFCNFLGNNPNENLIEYTARQICFMPKETGRNYITVKGLEICKAATQWAPPTAFQTALIGPYWAKGWIIENCKIHDSKCGGISLGKFEEHDDNDWTKRHLKGGAQTFTDINCRHAAKDWKKETVGSHRILNNEIYNCGEEGIMGNMGGIFSTIRGNYIHNINDRGEFTGCELGGIKIHAAIDTVIEKNVICNTSQAIHLDWEAQGAMVSGNVFLNNGLDLYIEVSHGPCIVENNVFLSKHCMINWSQGSSFVNNLILGNITVRTCHDRFTLYHTEHSTSIGGCMIIYGGDDRFYNNIMVDCGNGETDKKIGTSVYNGYNSDTVLKSNTNDTAFESNSTTLKTYAENNAYLNGAEAWICELNPVISDKKAEIEYSIKDGKVTLKSNIGELIQNCTNIKADTELLGKSFESGQAYELPDGSPYENDRDYFGNKRTDKSQIGPFNIFEPVIELN